MVMNLLRLNRQHGKKSLNHYLSHRAQHLAIVPALAPPGPPRPCGISGLPPGFCWPRSQSGPEGNAAHLDDHKLAFEHWYFDARLSDGHIVVGFIQTRELIQRKPGVELHVYRPDGTRVAGKLGIELRTIAIEPAHAAMLELMAASFEGTEEGITVGGVPWRFEKTPGELVPGTPPGADTDKVKARGWAALGA